MRWAPFCILVFAVGGSAGCATSLASYARPILADTTIQGSVDCPPDGRAPIRAALPTYAPVDAGPLTPYGRVVDHVLTSEKRFPGAERRDRSVLIRRGDLARLDRDEGPFSSTQYFNIGSGVIVSIGAGPQSGQSVSIMPARRSENATYPMAKVGRPVRVAGETCQNWHTLQSNWGPAWLSCVTHDGVQLQERIEDERDRQQYEAILLTRRCVTPSEVTPVQALAEARTWFAADLDDTTPPDDDYRLVLEGAAEDGGTDRKVMSRRGAWTLEDERRADGAGFRLLKNQARNISWMAQWGTRGQLISVVANRDVESLVDTVGEPLDRARENVMGQECRWLHVGYVVSHSATLQCVTDDGLVLIEDYIVRNRLRRTLRAVSVSRAPTEFETMGLDDTLLDPQTWGFPVP